MRRPSRQMSWTVATTVLAVTICNPLFAAVKPVRAPEVAQLELRHPGLDIETLYQSADELGGTEARFAQADLDALGLRTEQGRLDRRTGRWAMLLPATPLIPGDGTGNFLSWAAAPATDAEFRAKAWDAFASFLADNAGHLRIDPSQLSRPGRLTVHNGGDLVQIWVPRVIDGTPVRDSYLTASISHGNLVLFGTHNWGDLNAPVQARLSESAAVRIATDHVADVGMTGMWRRPTLTYLPMANGPALRSRIGQGLDLRLVWVVRPTLHGDQGNWEALIDAASGEMLAFQDTNHYATARNVKGGVYPVSNDGTPPDGVEHGGWPMPFDLVQTAGGEVQTDAGGNLPNPVDGNINSKLSGEFVHMNDNCGSISLTSSGDIDFGTSGGDDCVTPGFGGAGNTHSSRTGFHELNRIAELARSQLPANNWLKQTLTANMNINNTCNAFWNGTVNFYRSGGGCGNTGELAGVFDHEWGHGMDSNDTNPGISSPGEGIPDVYAALRLGTSCVGRGFFGGNCSGYGDPCTNCSGIRDIDWAMHQSGQPHDYSWSNATCGGVSHCQGYVYSESVWDIKARDLPAEYGMDENTALEVTQRLTYIGAGNVGTWFSGGPPFGGCGASGGYLNYLAADDDNGNINDGTPHMLAIFKAYNRHEIACNTPAVQDSGCVGTPTSAPVVIASPLDKSISLDWDPVAGATAYQVFRGDGVFECNFSKIKATTTAATSFIDEGLQNDRDYHYTVIPMGPASSCFGPASSCVTQNPSSGPNVGLDPASAVLTIGTGDGDDFLDNCEMASMTVTLSNTGLGPLTEVRLVDVTSPSHPDITIDSVFPILASPSDLGEDEVGTATFEFTAGGLDFNDTVILEVVYTADEVGVDKTGNLSIATVESDFQHFAALSYDFESDTQGWEVIEGTFDRSDLNGGANGSSWYEASSAFLSDQCDHIRSPVISMTETSTLSLWNRFDIEPIFQGNTWYDRANVGIYDVASNARRPVDPDGGRPYNATGDNGNCGTTGQDGWADSQVAWGESSWSAAALDSAGFAGVPIQLDIRYGTDALEHGFGFHFDDVTLTEVDLQVGDMQPDVCGGGFELTITGTCPGPVDISTSGGSGLGAVLRGTGPGSDVIPAGACAGTVSGLAGLTPVVALPLDINANLNSPEAACGMHIQILEMDSCTLTDVEQFP